ncbi:type IV secretion system protein, partial [Campylobacter coli]|nr:type IV secretion system protein [Campylobacter coli]ECQ5319739.1 type IV secretion system protein [Campylobacter jejuni]ECK7755314.1 type IV secretion system protein [Campylobacter coli]ECK8028608.1 type IV secretion system protein [Campylobacter coli]ECK8516016.1 type IV secretion system protein [Campylobacter coli]
LIFNTKEYNYNHDEISDIHHSSFRVLVFRHNGANLVANTPKNYIQKFKKSILILASLLILPNLAFSAGIPVVDATANQQMATQNAKQIAEWAKEASRWTETVSHYQKQIQAYKDELLSKTGIRDSVSFVKDVKQIYSDFAESGQNIQSFYNDVLRDPQDFLSDKGSEIFGKYTSFDRCNFDFMSQSEKNICKMNLITYAAQVETYNQASIQVNIVAKSLEKLHQKLIESKDIKETNGINNAINVEKTKLEIIKTNLEISNMHYENQRRIRQDQAAQLFQNQWGKSL